MAKTDRVALSLEKLASIPPVLPVISDHPLDTESAGQDKFELCYRLGPQDPNDEPAEKLQERIKTEKNKLKTEQKQRGRKGLNKKGE